MYLGENPGARLAARDLFKFGLAGLRDRLLIVTPARSDQFGPTFSEVNEYTLKKCSASKIFYALFPDFLS